MNLDTIEALFEDQIRDLYSAENQLLKALPKMAKRASNDSLRDAFTGHLEETRGHVERLQQIGDMMGIKLGGKKCHAMMGLIEEGAEAIDADGDDNVVDAALVAAAQRVEHYEIAAYGTARAFATRIGQSDAADLLQQTLDEEGAADKKLTQVCENELLAAAPVRAHMDEDSDAAPAAARSKVLANADDDENETDPDARPANRSRAAGRNGAGRAGGPTTRKGASSRGRGR